MGKTMADIYELCVLRKNVLALRFRFLLSICKFQRRLRDLYWNDAIEVSIDYHGVRLDPNAFFKIFIMYKEEEATEQRAKNTGYRYKYYGICEGVEFYCLTNNRNSDHEVTINAET